jgi:hypothetical protein
MKPNLILLTILLTALSAFPAEYFVDASRPDDSGAATNWVTAKQTIQAAVDVAIDGDMVLVTNGVYAAGGAVAPPFEPYNDGYIVTNALTNRVCITKAITVRSVNGAEETIIQGASDNGANGPAAARCAHLASGAVLEGFTLTGGHTCAAGSGGWYLDFYGGGALLFTNAVLNNCVLSKNSAHAAGGGVFCNDGGALNNCLLSGNTAGDGGGALVLGGTLNNCTLSGNTAREVLTQYGDTFGGAGGGALLYRGALNNSIVWGNTANNESNIGAYDGSTIRNTCSSPLPEGEGNICADPMFVDAANGDFHLQIGSPCINAGNNSYATATNDLKENPRIINGTVDMGAYEFYGAQDDYDGDGISNEWEARYFGNINQAGATAICSNGFNTIREAYIAGLDPNDPDSRFAATVNGQTLRWNATSGRVYSVYYSTNLLNGFEPLATNIPWTAGAFTDTVRSAQGQVFYKIGVELK